MVIFGEKYLVCDVNNVHLHLEIVKSILLTDACRWKSVYCRGMTCGVEIEATCKVSQHFDYRNHFLISCKYHLSLSLTGTFSRIHTRRLFSNIRSIFHLDLPHFHQKQN